MIEFSRASSRLTALPARLWRRYRRSYRERVALAALDGMNDQMLRDIGLERGGIREAVRNGAPGR